MADYNGSITMDLSSYWYLYSGPWFALFWGWVPCLFTMLHLSFSLHMFCFLNKIMAINQELRYCAFSLSPYNIILYAINCWSLSTKLLKSFVKILITYFSFMKSLWSFPSSESYSRFVPCFGIYYTNFFLAFMNPSQNGPLLPWPF